MKSKFKISELVKSKLGYAALLSVFSVIINILGFHIARTFGLPLYLNSTGTILASFVKGPATGVVVAFVTSFIYGAVDPQLMYCSSIYVIIALIVSNLKKHGFFKNTFRLYAAIPLIALAASVLGAFITSSIEGLDVLDKSAQLTAYLENYILNAGFAHYLAAFILELADKIIVVTAVVLIVRFTPKKLVHEFALGGIWQAPFDDDLQKIVHERKNRFISLRTKMLIIVITASLFVTLVAAMISSDLFKNNTLETNEEIVSGIATLAANAIDGDKVQGYLEKGEDAEGYTEVKDYLYSLRDSYEDIEYVYVYKILSDGCHVVFDLDTEDMEGSPTGSVIDFDPTFYEYLPALLAGEEIEPIISDDSYGWLMTSYKPIYDSYGVCRAYAAADISMKRLNSYKYEFLINLLSLLFGFLVFMITLCIWLVENNIILPVNTIASCAEAFVYDTGADRRSSVERTKRLDIRTGDEIETLYNAFVTTMSETIQYIGDIEKKTETISKMQSGLITVLADMVENRDQCTGDHIQKTVAYVRVILNKLKDGSAYADQITDDFINDVVNAAPLHDVGKIHISDVILNKPGKLTDEEFELMKEHTTFGRDIVNRAIEMVPESGYLESARNVAEYHHEKWNGKGYPHGLVGEDIPLSARVMAVADVFDALVSRRCYKEPFTFEEAMDIIKKDAGTHFDPVVVEAFVSCEDEVRRIADDFSKRECDNS